MRPPSDHADGDIILEVQNLTVRFPVFGGVFLRRTGEVRAVDDVSFALDRGETLGLVGESGCGKTTVGRAIVNILRAMSYGVEVERQDSVSPPPRASSDLRRSSRRAMRPYRADIQMVFQDPYSSLNPRKTVGQIVEEPFRDSCAAATAAFRARPGRGAARESRPAAEHSRPLSARVLRAASGSASASRARSRPIRRSSSPTNRSARSTCPIQAQVINLMQDLQEEFGLSYLFIAHDLSVVRHISNRIAVMYLGQIVEIGDAADDLQAAAASVLARVARGRAPARSECAAHARRAGGRPAVADEQAVGLPLSHSLPDRAARVRRGTSAARAARRAARRLPLLGVSALVAPLTPELTAELVRRALANIAREYPNHPQYLLDSDDGLAPPRIVHPVFFGCFDWHSAVHTHWLLVRLLRAPRHRAPAQRDRELARRRVHGRQIARRGTVSRGAPVVRASLRPRLADVAHRRNSADALARAARPARSSRTCERFALARRAALCRSFGHAQSNGVRSLVAIRRRGRARGRGARRRGAPQSA